MATGQTAFPFCSVFTSHYFTAENQQNFARTKSLVSNFLSSTTTRQ